MKEFLLKQSFLLQICSVPQVIVTILSLVFLYLQSLTFYSVFTIIAYYLYVNKSSPTPSNGKLMNPYK